MHFNITWSRLIISSLFVLMAIASIPANAADRIALVIGNSNYQNFDPNPNGIGNADLIVLTLEHLGFETTRILDADHQTLKNAIAEFADKASQSTEIALIYYSGKGHQIAGSEVMIPIDQPANADPELPSKLISIAELINATGNSKAKSNIIIYDADRTPGPELKQNNAELIKTPTGSKNLTLVYATAPGQKVIATPQPNNHFAQAFTEAVLTPGLKLSGLFKLVRVKLFELSGGKQMLWVSSQGEVVEIRLR